MGSGAGRIILPLVSLAAAPLTGGASLGGLAGAGAGAGGLGTAIGLANAGINALRDQKRSRSEDAAIAAEIQSARTDRLFGELDLAERRTETEKRRAAALARIANSGGLGPRARADLAGAADRDSQAAFSSLANREVALRSRARNRIASLRRRGRRNRGERDFQLFEDLQRLGRTFGDPSF